MSDVHQLVSNFNSFKSLIHYERMKGITEGIFHAPVTVEIDPVVACNHGCLFCIAERFMEKTPVAERIAKSDVIMSYLERFRDWGVKGVVFVGGGEPTLHPKFPDMLRAAKSNGLEIGLITNGSMLHKPAVMNAVVECVRWMGVSFDAATPNTHAVLHDTKQKPGDEPQFYQILSAMSVIASHVSSVTLKYVLSPWNLTEAPRAIDLAYDYNIPEVYYRPAYMGMYESTPELQERALKHGVDTMYKGIDHFWLSVNSTIRAIEDHLRDFNNSVFEADKIKVSISKKKMEDYLSGNRSPKCMATPLLCVMSGDGKVHLCCDRREEEFLTLCDYTQEDMLAVWGSKRHKDIIEQIDVKRCPRCRLEIHNQILNSLDKDTMQVNFI